ncbi:MAG: universal stress protein [Candidatus Bathyarchaeota archaeon]|nr:universal stress protein [Candidatus Bathyarchaeota archaeon]
MINKILVALDGSEISEHALDFALELAHQYSAEIQLLTVVPPVLLPAYSFDVAKSEAIADMTAQLERSFRGVLSKAEEKAKKTTLKVSTKLEHGSPDEVIVEIAKREKFEIIVMGSRGLGHRGYGLGSVSSAVADNATCPVLIVK